MPFAIAGFLFLHGLITTAIGFGGVTKPDAPPMVIPGFSWWPGPFGRSWLFDALHLGTPAAIVGGLLWLIAGLALIAGALGFVGLPALHGIWQLMLLSGAVAGLLALALYFHPIYVIAVVINVAIVAVVVSQLAARATP
jgi:hypothetical protein